MRRGGNASGSLWRFLIDKLKFHQSLNTKRNPSAAAPDTAFSRLRRLRHSRGTVKALLASIHGVHYDRVHQCWGQQASGRRGLGCPVWRACLWCGQQCSPLGSYRTSELHVSLFAGVLIVDTDSPGRTSLSVEYTRCSLATLTRSMLCDSTHALQQERSSS